jgi:hypothetical protein
VRYVDPRAVPLKSRLPLQADSPEAILSNVRTFLRTTFPAWAESPGPAAPRELADLLASGLNAHRFWYVRWPSARGNRIPLGYVSAAALQPLAEYVSEAVSGHTAAVDLALSYVAVAISLAGLENHDAESSGNAGWTETLYGLLADPESKDVIESLTVDGVLVTDLVVEILRP